MLRIPRSFLWTAVVAVCFLSGIAVSVRSRNVSTANKSSSTSAPFAPAPRRDHAKGTRNLALQPEAFKLSRRLGRRFVTSDQEVSVATGELVTGTDSQPVHLTRRQNERGEEIEIRLGGRNLSWDASDGAKSNGNRAADVDRKLIERLAFDSADEFVLAQLRGASYQIVARNVRTDSGGGNDYAGPLWTVVRVDDLEKDHERKRESAWRLFYINARTGLLDKVVSESDGEQIEASLNGWITVDGETVPSVITWSRDGRQLMQLKLNTFLQPTAE